MRGLLGGIGTRGTVWKDPSRRETSLERHRAERESQDSSSEMTGPSARGLCAVRDGVAGPTRTEGRTADEEK